MKELISKLIILSFIFTCHNTNASEIIELEELIITDSLIYSNDMKENSFYLQDANISFHGEYANPYHQLKSSFKDRFLYYVKGKYEKPLKLIKQDYSDYNNIFEISIEDFTNEFIACSDCSQLREVKTYDGSGGTIFKDTIYNYQIHSVKDGVALVYYCKIKDDNLNMLCKKAEFNSTMLNVVIFNSELKVISNFSNIIFPEYFQIENIKFIRILEKDRLEIYTEYSEYDELSHLNFKAEDDNGKLYFNFSISNKNIDIDSLRIDGELLYDIQEDKKYIFKWKQYKEDTYKLFEYQNRNVLLEVKTDDFIDPQNVFISSNLLFMRCFYKEPKRTINYLIDVLNLKNKAYHCDNLLSNDWYIFYPNDKCFFVLNHTGNPYYFYLE